MQDDIVASIATAVGPEITLAEIERSRGKRRDDLDAWDRYLRAIAAYHRMTKQDMDAAIADLESAISIDPEFANAHALLGLCCAVGFVQCALHSTKLGAGLNEQFALHLQARKLINRWPSCWQ